MASVVKFKVTEDGDAWPDNHWHAVFTFTGDWVALCCGQCFGYGQGRIEKEGRDFLQKDGKTDCPKCIEIIKGISSIDYKGKKKK